MDHSGRTLILRENVLVEREWGSYTFCSTVLRTAAKKIKSIITKKTGLACGHGDEANAEVSVTEGT
jgi:hypothetical protein